MNLILLNKFYQQIMLFSENGKSNIEHVSIMMHETCKSTGIPRTEVRVLFNELINIGFLEKVPNEEYAYKVKNMMSVDELIIFKNAK